MGMTVCIGLASYAGCRPSYPSTPIFQIGRYGRLTASTSPFLTPDRPSGCPFWALPADGFSAWLPSCMPGLLEDAGGRWEFVGFRSRIPHSWCNGDGFDFKTRPLALTDGHGLAGYVRTVPSSTRYCGRPLLQFGPLHGTSFGAMRVRGWMCRCWLAMLSESEESESDNDQEDESAESRTTVPERWVYCFALGDYFGSPLHYLRERNLATNSLIPLAAGLSYCAV